LQVLVDVYLFSSRVINLSRNKNICRGLKKVIAKSRKRVNFVQQILALLLVFHQTHNLACNNFARALANQPIRALHFFNLQQMFLLRIKLIMQGEKRETDIDQNLQRNNVARQVEGFCISYFAAFSRGRNNSEAMIGSSICWASNRGGRLIGGHLIGRVRLYLLA